MTGFGKAFLQLPNKKITVELKSLNSKGLDLNVRTPSIYREMELQIRNTIAQKLERGKIDFSLYIEVTGEETSAKINVPIIKGYMNQMREVLTNADEVELMKMAVRMPDALKTERDEIDENELAEILQEQPVQSAGVMNNNETNNEIEIEINNQDDQERNDESNLNESIIEIKNVEIIFFALSISIFSDLISSIFSIK